ncbi:amidase [Luedemannella helvata]|uniref:Amidase n=1 Tax=Luedemannella helvata TaxID=349315 RepID=A0ABN2L2A5_9ACTN
MTDGVWRVGPDAGGLLAGPTGAGPLDGLRVAVKDLIAVAGHPTGGGNPTWLAGALPERCDATALAALRGAGASVAGIAHTDELAYSLSGTNIHYGAPPNAAAPDRVTGGSSSGPAAAVAAGLADIGLGTDTAGSIRVPASCCGLFGLRPTHGAVPDDGVLALAPTFDTVGWLTRDPATLAAVAAVLLPPGDTAPPSRLLVSEAHLAAVAAGTATVVRDAVARAAGALGVPVVTVAVPWEDDLPGLLAAFRTVQAAQAWRLRGEWIEANPGALAPDVEARFRHGATVTPADEIRAVDRLDAWRDRFADLLGGGAWLALPAAGGPGHPRGVGDADRDAWRAATLACAVPAAFCGFPSLSLPALAAGDPRAPRGLALVAPPGADAALVAAARLVGGSGVGH